MHDTHDSAAVPFKPRQTVAPLPTALPGWYQEPGASGVLRYWNGSAWEEWRRPLVPLPMAPAKDMTIAYVLAIFVGVFGAHNFYLGRTGVAVTQLVLYVVGILLIVAFGLGLFLMLGVGVWLVVDLFLIPGFVRAANDRLAAQARFYGTGG